MITVLEKLFDGVLTQPAESVSLAAFLLFSRWVSSCLQKLNVCLKLIIHNSYDFSFSLYDAFRDFMTNCFLFMNFKPDQPCALCVLHSVDATLIFLRKFALWSKTHNSDCVFDLYQRFGSLKAEKKCFPDNNYRYFYWCLIVLTITFSIRLIIHDYCNIINSKFSHAQMLTQGWKSSSRRSECFTWKFEKFRIVETWPAEILSTSPRSDKKKTKPVSQSRISRANNSRLRMKRERAAEAIQQKYRKAEIGRCLLILLPIRQWW